MFRVISHLSHFVPVLAKHLSLYIYIYNTFGNICVLMNNICQDLNAQTSGIYV